MKDQNQDWGSFDKKEKTDDQVVLGILVNIL